LAIVLPKPTEIPYPELFAAVQPVIVLALLALMPLPPFEMEVHVLKELP
jgi:hypothetical protein